eukprot:PhF_6_TR12489/c0_g1_i1/m.19622/K12832/SF3B5, SF3B10; splicing factor 3B subunit 5
MSDPFMKPGQATAAHMEHLISRVTGTLHADASKFDICVEQQRDTLASCVGHPYMVSYIATAENESHARIRSRLLDRMLQPCGPVPPPELVNGPEVDTDLYVEMKKTVVLKA